MDKKYMVMSQISVYDCTDQGDIKKVSGATLTSPECDKEYADELFKKICETVKTMPL